MNFSISELDLTVNPHLLVKFRGLRVPCPKCGKKYQYFCRVCNIDLLPTLCAQFNIPAAQYTIPEITLPIKTTILLSELEDYESSSIPFISCLPVSNLQCKRFNDSFNDVEPNSALLMPGPDSIHVSELPNSVKNLYIIDCKWYQCSRLLQNSPELNKLPKVVLNNYTSQFWRPHGRKFEGCLSSAECVYYASKELSLRSGSNSGSGGNGSDGNNTLENTQGKNIDDLLTYYANNILIVKRYLFGRNIKHINKDRESRVVYENWEEIKKGVEARWGSLEGEEEGKDGQEEDIQ
ncbi:DTW_domain-containing protein [Hexamita inflata]|uniref:tRNA-uridine aminocarboxypropyltransferase 1 n=1 Tax=Hexamita inflata TaxID=28002 RepID=A0AA86RH62_9EUKA|nr:DTW domain-containing protein [Hexamita inflata]